MTNKKKMQYWLPKAFEGRDGKVDVALLTELLSTIPKSASTVRRLLKDICSVSLKPTDSAIEILAEVITDRSVFNRWCDHTKYPNLIGLVFSFNEKKLQALSYSELQRIEFLTPFNGVKSASVPNLEKIGDLIATIQATSEEPRYIALFIWQLIMNSHLASSKYPNEKRFKNLESNILSALQTANLDHISQLVVENNWTTPEFKQEIKSTSDKRLETRSATLDKPPRVMSWPEKDLYSGRLSSIIDKHTKYCAAQKQIISRLSNIHSAEDSKSSFKTVKDQIAILEKMLDEIKIDSINIVTDLNEFVSDSLATIGVKILSKSNTSMSIFHNNLWESLVLSKIESAEEVFGLFETLAHEESIEKIRLENIENQKEYQEDDLTSILNECKEKYSCISRGILVEEKIADLIGENLRYLEWNLFSDDRISNEMWMSLGQYYTKFNNICSRLGMVVHKRFDAFCESFGKLLSTAVAKNRANTANYIATLSWLSLGQQDHLAKIYPELKTLIALTQVDAYLNSLELERDYYGFWNGTTLAEILHGNSNQHAKEFLKSIYELIYTSPVDRKKLLKCASAVQLDMAKSLDKHDLHHSLIRDLNDVLTYRKKGGKTTYAHIWQAAYDEIFSPQLSVLSAEGPEAFIKNFNAWDASFEIDDHMDSWKQEIPDHLKKNSEYDKFIRNHVSIKVLELKNWIDVYLSLDKNQLLNSEDALSSVRSSLQVIFNSSDHESSLIRHWLEAKLNDSTNKSNRYVNSSPDIYPGHEFNEKFNNFDPYHPRAFSIAMDKAVSYETIYTDDFISTFGCYTIDNLLEIYVDNEIFEGYTLLASETNEEISPVLDRAVEKRLEEIDFELRGRLQSLESEGFLEQSFSKTLSDIKSLIESQQWRLAEQALSSAEIVADDLREKEKLREVNEQLMDRIGRLGGHPNASSTSSSKSLQEILDQLLVRNRARRTHIKVLEKLAVLNCRDFEQELSDCIEMLDQYKLYPTEVLAEQLAFYFEQAVLPLCAELSRSRTLLPSYISQLKLLSKSLLLNIKEDQDLFNDNSRVVSILVETAELWPQLSSEGKLVADRIINVFIAKGLPLPDQHDVDIEAPEIDEPINESKSGSLSSPVQNEVNLLSGRARSIVAKINNTAALAELSDLLNSRSWNNVEVHFIRQMKHDEFQIEADIVNWAVSHALSDNCEFDQLELAAVIRLINRKYDSSVIRFLHRDKLSRAKVGDLLSRFIKKMVAGEKSDKDHLTSLEVLQELANDPSAVKIHQDNFRYCFDIESFDQPCIKAYWDSFSGDQKQAEIRALFMNLSWKMRSEQSLAYCLTLPPIDIEKRKSEALSRAAISALLTGDNQILQAFLDLRKSTSAKPFHIFVDLVDSSSVPRGKSPARISLQGGLERHQDGLLHSVLKVEPRRVDSPDSISIRLPSNCPVQFENGTHTKELSGPFFSDTSVPISFLLIDEYATNFTIEVECTALSLTGNYFKYSQKIEFSINSDVVFTPFSSDDIDDAFNNFPDAHMRGDEYVLRAADEQKIEKALFKSKTVRSVWISSPRRSGKTTMLYRILDAYSHKANRDNIVVYLTLDESFEDTTSFNKWLWRRLRNFTPNRELRELYSDFESIGKGLPFDSDSGTFLGELSDRLLKSRPIGTRIIFLIDEIDRFASMYFEGGSIKSTANDILWQIRHTITDRRDIGIVFAGSSAAKQIFIVNAESPFYNSIDHLELSPFSVKTKLMEDASRQIVEPLKIRTKYSMPKESLEHLIWICAGIPYYMKLVAGATYSIAKQSHILKADINEGLRALLSKETGISKLDDMGGDPGSDDLRTTIAIEKRTESVLAKAVLYALAELYSPLNGHRPYRGKISSEESRLISHYKISRAKIERGLDICVGLGLIRMIETESTPEIEFATPILGESLRKSSGRYWANIDHELISLT